MLERFIDWYITVMANDTNSSASFNSFIKFLLQEDFSIIRANMGNRTLHPQVETVAYLWVANKFENLLNVQQAPLFHSSKTYNYPEGVLQEARFTVGAARTDQFKASPIQYVLKTRKTYYFSFLEHSGNIFPYSILEELAQYNTTGYVVIPFLQGGDPFAFMSLATDRPEGFTKEQLNFLEKVIPIFSVRWIGFMQSEITESLLGVYLGKHTGSLVSSGKVYRGDLEKINSIIWFSDIRNYSGLSENLSPEEVIQLLNGYFGVVIPNIEKNGGEVLKMLGDGILAVFPYENGYRKRVGLKALIAVRKVFEDLRILNKTRIKETKTPIRHGVGLHLGEIMYGNIGSPERLDFTVIGEAVNLTSRIAGMCGVLKKAVLASEEFAREVGVRWENIGEHKLKGFANPRNIYAIPEEVKR